MVDRTRFIVFGNPSDELKILSLVRVDDLAVLTNESLVTQDATLAPGGIRHLGSQCLKVVEPAGFNCQLNHQEI